MNAEENDQLTEGRATRRRGAVLEAALLDAAWAVLTEEGYSGFTYDAIAARAETGRAVLYRRWPHREQLLDATLRHFWEPIDLPDTGSLREDALALLRTINDKRAEMIVVLIVHLADYFRDTNSTLTDLRARIIGSSGREAPFEVLIKRAVERGELASEPGAGRVKNLPFDLLRGEMIMRSGPADDATFVEIVDAIWLPLLHDHAREHALRWER